MERIYLDNAATSWPKPESVYEAVDHAQREIGAPAGRGGYQQVVKALRLVEQTRGQVARFINAPRHANVSFTFNGTDSLSTAIFGLLKQGDHVVTSVVEHNSVLRPLNQLESAGVIDVTYVGCDAAARFNADEVIAAARPQTRLVCLIHASNVTGSIQPVEHIKFRLRDSGNDQAVFLLDAAQSLGHIPIDVQSLGCDVLAAPGHKGLLGPLGTGVLYVSDEFADSITPLRYGGTGTDRSVEIQPTTTPDKFESGNLNVPGIAGLSAGIKFLTSEEGKTLHARNRELSELLLAGIQTLPRVKLQGPTTMDNRMGVFSFSIEGLDCHEASSILDTNWSIQTRSGLHCAPLLHRSLETQEQGGTIRMSVGLFNSKEQIETTIEAITQLANQST